MVAISSNGTGGGNWSAAAAWAGGAVPVEGDTATIVVGDTITIDQTITVGADTATAAIAVNGIIDVPYNVAADYILTVKGDLVINSGGEFNIGDASNNLNSNRKFTVKLNYSGSPSVTKYGLINNDGGKFRTYGTTKSMETTLAANVAALGTQITVQAGEYAGWKVGDQITIAVTDTSLGRQYTEQRQIQSINPVTHVITLTAGLTYAHSTGAQVLILSHNIIITVHNTSYKGYVINYSKTAPNFHCDYTEFNYQGSYYGTQKNGVIFNGSGVRGEIVHVSIHHGYVGLYFYNAAGNTITALNSYNNDKNGLTLRGAANTTVITLNACSCQSSGLYVWSNSNYLIVTALNSYSNISRGCDLNSLSGASCNSIITHNNGYGVQLSTVHDSVFTTINTYTNGGESLNLTSSNRNTLTTVNAHDTHMNHDTVAISSCIANVFTTLNIYNNNWKGLYLSRTIKNVFKTLNIYNSSTGAYIRETTTDIVMVGVFGEHGGIPAPNSHDVTLYAYDKYSGITFRKSVKLSSPTQVYLDGAYPGSFIKCHNLGAVVGAHKQWVKTSGSSSGYCTIGSDTTIFRTVSPSVVFEPHDASGWGEQVFCVAADANTARNISIYMRDDAAFNGSVEIEARFNGEVVAGPVAKVMTTSFVEQTITIPAVNIPEDGVIELFVKVKGTAGHVYADDLAWS